MLIKLKSTAVNMVTASEPAVVDLMTGMADSTYFEAELAVWLNKHSALQR